MTIPSTRLTFQETMAGHFALGETEFRKGQNKGENASTELAMHASITIDDMNRFINDPQHQGEISGSIDFAPLGKGMIAENGVFNLFKPTDSTEETRMIYELGFQHEGENYYLAGQKIVKDDPGFDLWSDTTTLYTALHKGKNKDAPIVGAGILTLGVSELVGLVKTIEVPNAKDTAEKLHTLQSFGQFFLGELWDTYGISKFSNKKIASTESHDSIDYDFIIIGSGFGGSVTACRLAQKGYSVCILERGHRWKVEDYPREPSDNWWWNKDKPASKNGWIDLQMYEDMGVAQGAGVGGGSLIYANVFIDAQPFAFDEGWPEAINYETLKPYYEKTAKVINPQTIPDNQLTARAKLMKKGAEAIGEGARYRKVDLAVSFSEKWNYELTDPFNEDKSHTYTNAQGVKQGTCIHCGNCDIGCEVRAKNTLDLNYIPLAEQHGAIVKPLHIVNKISELAGKGYRVDFDIIDPDTEVLRAANLNASRVIVAAGTMGTNELMLRCRDEHGSLPKLSQQLGKNWSSNGDFLTPAVYPGEDIAPTRGPTISSAIDFLDGSQDGHRFFVEDGGFPDVLGNALGAYSDNLQMGFMASSIAGAIRNRNPISCIMPWFGQAVDAADGDLSIQRSWIPPFRRKMNLNWSIDRSEDTIQSMVDMHKKLSEATGGTPLVPASWKYLKDLVTPHPLGGCKMGDDESKGVVNDKGEVFNYPGLYIADGSIFPVSIGLNPSKTIAALAERIADHIEE